MLQLKNIQFAIPGDEEDILLLNDISLEAHKGHFMAIVGPSGCGKSTLLKTIAGINEHTGGQIFWDARDLEEDGDLEPTEVAYVPQFSIAYDPLTVAESVLAATRLRVSGGNRRIQALTRYALKRTGLWDIRQREAGILSGGQKRRLGLAMELVANPDLLLADEVTSGLDPKSEKDITLLLQRLSREGDGRLVINVTHSLGALSLYDSVLVLYDGHIAYHGPARALKHYFSVESAEDIYPQLATRYASAWARSWEKNRADYYGFIQQDQAKEQAAREREAAAKETAPGKDGEDSESTPDSHDDCGQALDEQATSSSTISLKKAREEKNEAASATDQDREDATDEEDVDIEENDEDLEDQEDSSSDETIEDLIHAPVRTPGLIVQTFVLLARRWRIFMRDRTQFVLHAAMLIGFPILVAIFTLEGIDQPRSAPEKRGTDIAADIQQQILISETNMSIGGLVSGLVMFQVILLTLMGSNNSAREIAGERQIYEKERFAGLKPASYLLSKVLFLAGLVLAQAFWMAAFVEMVTQGLPGEFSTRLTLLLLVNAAMTAVCLGISSLLDSPEQSSLLSIYLVGFQLPLSGAILTLPAWLEPVIQPLVAAFWSWSGSLASMEETTFYDAVKSVTETRIPSTEMCIYVLLCHLAVGLIAAFIGCRQHRWKH